MCDTRFVAAAIDEAGLKIRVSDLSMTDLSRILRRAQELKDADAAARAKEQGSSILGRCEAHGNMWHPKNFNPDVPCINWKHYAD